jgi:hypothetical protein
MSWMLPLQPSELCSRFRPYTYHLLSRRLRCPQVCPGPTVSPDTAVMKYDQIDAGHGALTGAGAQGGPARPVRSQFCVVPVLCRQSSLGAGHECRLMPLASPMKNSGETNLSKRIQLAFEHRTEHFLIPNAVGRISAALHLVLISLRKSSSLQSRSDYTGSNLRLDQAVHRVRKAAERRPMRFTISSNLRDHDPSSSEPKRLGVRTSLRTNKS